MTERGFMKEPVFVDGKYRKSLGFMASSSFGRAIIGDLRMLVLSRKECEALFIGDDVVVEVLEIKGNRVKLGITAPSGVRIVRCELKVGPTPTDEDKEQQRDAA